jgi:translocation protein SEC62
MIATVLAILFVVLFPIWPYELKYYVWYASLILLIFSVGLLVVRLALYSILSLFGYSFWLFPNLLSESSFIESWKPSHSI